MGIKVSELAQELAQGLSEYSQEVADAIKKATDEVAEEAVQELKSITYEIISILKNMYLCGLPVKKIWQTVKAFLQKYTDELPTDEEAEEPETLEETAAQEEGAAK